MHTQLLLNIQRTQFLVELDAIEAGAEVYDIDTREQITFD